MNTIQATTVQELITDSFVRKAIEAEIHQEKYPINFDEVWHLIGYARKDSAVRALRNKLEEYLDWIVSHNEVENSEGRQAGNYKLSVDAFKMFCMMAETEEGRETRLYFIRAEAKYRLSLENLLHQGADLPKIYQDLATAHARIQHLEADIKAMSSTRNDITQISHRKVFLPNRDEFNIAIVTACDVIGYASISYLMKILKEEFVQECDWTINKLGEVFITEACLHELTIVARPQKGAKVQNLPEILIVERDRMFKSVDDTKANRRFGTRSS
jgi:phage anti-repressor protein